MKQITLTQGKVTVVSDHRYDELNQYKWCAVFNGFQWYAARISGKRPNRKMVYMHTHIMHTPHGMEVDHIDKDTFNNQDENLRLCTHAENNRNKGLQRNNKSGYKGVHWHKGAKKWQARIKVNQKTISLGLFVNIKDAAVAYNNAVGKYHGAFGSINPMEGIPS